MAVYRDRYRCRRGNTRLCPGESYGVVHGKGRVVCDTGRCSSRRADVFERGGDHSDHPGASRERGIARHIARVHDVGHRTIASRDDHSQEGAYHPADSDFRGDRRGRHHDCRFYFQSDLLGTEEL